MTAAIAEIAALLQQHLGLASGSVGTRVIESAVHRRMTAIGLTEPRKYVTRVSSDKAELDELVESVVVPETWFYRYPESFKHLAKWANARRPKPSVAQPLRILSAPCATGEEPYSISATLLDAGFAPEQFRIEAVDVSRHAIEYGLNGTYGNNAFREHSVTPSPEYFQRQGNEARVTDRVRLSVSFRMANLAQSSTLVGHECFDVIFCRNLFIYLTDEAKRIMIATIDRLLAPDGVIYMGHAEPLGLFDGRFHSVPPPQAFAFARAATAAAAQADPGPFLSYPLGPGQTILSPPKSGRMTFPPRPTTAVAMKAIPAPSMVAPTDPLVQARQAADRGQMLEAAVFCEAYLAASGPNPEALTLLGTARMAIGQNAEAERAFTQALYLEPAYYDALLNMLLLAQKRGDTQGVSNYRRRAEAAAKQRGNTP